jgi:hypothetical protein
MKVREVHVLLAHNDQREAHVVRAYEDLAAANAIAETWQRATDQKPDYPPKGSSINAFNDHLAAILRWQDSHPAGEWFRASWFSVETVPLILDSGSPSNGG